MRLLILLTLLTLTSSGYSQRFYIGLTKTQIIAKVSLNGHSYAEKKLAEGGQNYIEWKTETALFVTMIDADDTCRLAYIYPNSEEVKDDIIASFNEDYEVVNNSEWVFKNKYHVLNIYMFTKSSKIPYFGIRRKSKN